MYSGGRLAVPVEWPSIVVRSKFYRSIVVVFVLALLLGCAGDTATETHTQGAEQFAASAFHEALEKAKILLDRYGYAAVFGAIFLEGIGIPAPGEVLVLAAFAEAGRGSLNIVLLATLTILAAVAGNSVGYAIGRFGGRRILLKLPMNEDRLTRATALFDRYGGWFILVARFIDGPRQLNGIIAGTLNMPWWQFSFWNLAGALLWVLVWGGGAYWFGRDFTKIVPALQRFESLAIGLLIAALLGGLITVWWRRSRTS